MVSNFGGYFTLCIYWLRRKVQLTSKLIRSAEKEENMFGLSNIVSWVRTILNQITRHVTPSWLSHQYTWLTCNHGRYRKWENNMQGKKKIKASPLLLRCTITSIFCMVNHNKRIYWKTKVKMKQKYLLY